MTVPCPHPRTGVVESYGSWGKSALAPVCSEQECIDAAKAWVRQVTGKPARHVLDEVVER
jgi:hypothetical protein